MEVGKVQPNLAVSQYIVAPLSAQQRAEQQEIIHAVESVNRMHLLGEYTELTFTFDRAARKPVLKIVDTRTKEVVQQIPAEYVLRLAQRHHNEQRG
ncbi:MAG: flagellar protein FlaG [Bryobacterales bacterium]|nr:flagellar protein FlaG [Bryobacterales bacterium]